MRLLRETDRMTATERPSDRELLDEAIDLLRGAVEYRNEFSAFISRARTLDAAPADPVVSAECWRRAIADIFGGDMIATVELHAIELAKEQSRGR